MQLTAKDRDAITNLAGRVELTLAWHELDWLLAHNFRLLSSRNSALWRMVPMTLYAAHRAPVGLIAAHALKCMRASDGPDYTHADVNAAKRLVVNLLGHLPDGGAA